ncbi:hypothetical protein JYB62_13425 [Algoriphagus lutimaris]|uniref:DUF6090 family protein n=1 Tax=Algoriphagus lutimaris TaxID=613197 RepID=UPI00196AF6F0|nr:DUF6090 family protein [Algoriphagus lutimaris]MBN3521004.1 hypothetical protein [Algoriphagus lutimaris]
MISFFRKIRQKLFSQNRITRYLLYALGEIFLVVIGILIALQVNNWNEERNNFKKTEQLLIEIQKDLSNDYSEIGYSSDFYQLKDSLALLFLSDTVFDLNPNHFTNRSIQKIGKGSFPVTISNQSFRNLDDNREIIPEQFKEIVRSLGLFYTERISQFESVSGNLLTIEKNLDQYLAQQPGYIAMQRDSITQENLEFYLQDPIFKNFVFKYHQAIEEYQVIGSILQNKVIAINQIINEILVFEKNQSLDPLLQITYTKKELEEYTGSYISNSGSDTIYIFDYHGLLAGRSSENREIYEEFFVLEKIGEDSVRSIGFEQDLAYFIRNEEREVEAIKNYWSNRESFIISKKLKNK